MSNESHPHAEELHHEPLPLMIYGGVFGGLLFLTFITVFISQFHFGDWNLVVAMAVAVVKASLVVLYFMNLKHDHDRFNGVVFLTGLLFLVIFTGPTLWDKFTRHDVDPTRGATVGVSRPGYPPGVSGHPLPEAGKSQAAVEAAK
ncbi:cytochrome C oxidase subunit IV family protein [Vulgatibacter incomptus]|uniref:Cytochrome c oxidase polypeptide IV n=1 Tax=Vulgatibacter incomptus TaxID=1391653 RepID=A0A0K1PI68_9BACT|nr:cytochrome C oxidase subunit IV family protein [Vulgatibacter incomptus]AKU92804.1 Cytochrome c oxidase polypeptide IV [Vulgatibacter incomptus]